MNGTRPGLYAVLLIFVTLSANAHEPLTLERCLVLARQNSPQLRMAANAVRAAELSANEVSTASLPQVSAAAGARYAPVPPVFGYDPALSDGGHVAAQLVLRQSLYDAGIRGLKVAQLSVDHARFGMERRVAELDLTLAVKQAFAEALLLREELALEERSLEQLNAYRNLVQLRSRAGMAPYADLLKTDIQLQTARVSRQQAQESLRTALSGLAGLMGVSSDSTLEPAGTLAELPDSLVCSDDPQAHGTVSSNLDVAVAGLLVERTVHDRELARHEYLPDVSLLADFGYLSSGENLRLPAGERFSGWGYSVGIGIEMPILNWGATGLRVEQREIAIDDVRQRQELLRRSVDTEMRNTTAKLSGARERLHVLGESMGTARENYLLTKAQYAAGGASALEVLAAHQAETEARLSHIRTLAEIHSLAARCERLHAR